MQIICNDKTVRNHTIQDLKDFNQQSLTTQAKKGEQLVPMMPAIKKAFNLLGDDLVELSVENESLKNQIGDYNEKWLQESKAKLLKDIDDEKRANLIMSRMKKQMNKQKIIKFDSVSVNLHIFKFEKYYNYYNTCMNNLNYL